MSNITFALSRDRTSGDGMEEQRVFVSKCEQVDKSDQEGTRHGLRRITSTNVQENVHRKASTGSVINTNSLLPLPGLNSLYRRAERMTRSLEPIIPNGELVQLTPRFIRSSFSLGNRKITKNPKFIPYEPYPGATNQIVVGAKPGATKKLKLDKNNIDIGVLVNQMSTLRTEELGGNISGEKLEVSGIKDTNFDTLREELRIVKEERDYYQAQFKFQTQVNSELKNLLVASVGEDLQAHVNILTEDKLQLARALLDTANNLTTHTEQIEFLASQCEVWRSKFLASSVMVEELARWKADLTQKNEMLNESTKRLLQTTYQIRKINLEVLGNLKFVAKLRYLSVPSTDIVSLSAEILNIIQQMVLHSGVGIPEASLDILSPNTKTLCDAEKYAINALQFVSQPLMATDDALRALFGQVKRPYGQIILNETEKSTVVD